MRRKAYSPPHYKKYTQDIPIVKMPAPSEVILPLLQHAGAPGEPIVLVKDKVKVGQLVASAEKFISASIHSSVSGEIKAIEKRPHPVLGTYNALVIANDGHDTFDDAIVPRENIDALSADEVRKIVRSCGVVGLGGAGFPTHVKLAPPKEKPIDSFILNGAECEPFLTADHRLMLEKTQEILSGMRLAMKTLAVEKGFIAIEDNKPDAIAAFNKLIDGEKIKIVALASFYPQGEEKQMIKTVLNREVPSGGLPFDVGVVMQNVATALAIHEAVSQNKPLYERVLTVSGALIKNPANLLVRIGTKVKDIIEYCGGFIEPPAKIVVGGPMMGIAQYTQDVPVIKGTSGILAFSRNEVKREVTHPCIRCSKCLKVCPMGLNPTSIARAIERGNYELAQEYNVMDCVECGACSYICPGNSNIVGLIKLAKQKIREKIKT